MTHDWLYEPCDTESARTPAGLPWEHAVRGLKPGGRRVMGYGMTEPDAYTDAHEKARQYDAREVIGERGEVVAGIKINVTATAREKIIGAGAWASPIIEYDYIIIVSNAETGEEIVRGRLVAGEFNMPAFTLPSTGIDE